jgi:hypothetical protein
MKWTRYGASWFNSLSTMVDWTCPKWHGKLVYNARIHWTWNMTLYIKIQHFLSPSLNLRQLVGIGLDWIGLDLCRLNKHHISSSTSIESYIFYYLFYYEYYDGHFVAASFIFYNNLGWNHSTTKNPNLVIFLLKIYLFLSVESWVVCVHRLWNRIALKVI